MATELVESVSIDHTYFWQPVELSKRKLPRRVFAFATSPAETTWIVITQKARRGGGWRDMKPQPPYFASLEEAKSFASDWLSENG